MTLKNEPSDLLREFVRKLPKTLANIEDSVQLVDASGSVGANYIEANEAISKKILPTESRYAGKNRRKADTGLDSSR